MAVPSFVALALPTLIGNPLIHVRLSVDDSVKHSEKGKESYKLRKERIERVFAEAKGKHGLRFTQYEGIARLKMQVLLTFACMSLKKLQV